MTTTIKSGTCGKCDGAGRIRAFSHRDNGVCYWCQGTGQISYTVDVAAECRAEYRAIRAQTLVSTPGMLASDFDDDARAHARTYGEITPGTWVIAAKYVRELYEVYAAK